MGIILTEGISLNNMTIEETWNTFSFMGKSQINNPMKQIECLECYYGKQYGC
jgi:hypothetical protein